MTLKELVKNIRYRLAGRVVHLTPAGAAKGNVLISYFAYPFLTDKPLTGHTNYWEVRRMAQEFIDRGYNVDVIDTVNASFTPKKKYDICIDTHSNLDRLAPLLGDHCVKVLHTTTTHWLVQNTASYKRSVDLLKRRGVALPPERLLPPSSSLEAADILLTLGNEVTQQSYAYAGKPVFCIPLSAVGTFPSPESKDFASARTHFVWLGGAGAVHKGADITLEAFAQEKDLSLSLAGKYLYPAFEKLYWKELHEMNNIHSIGHLDLSGPKFEELRTTCAFLIFPSCAEGQSGGVIAAMHAGLIPIVTKECGVDMHDFGFVLADATVEEIRRTIRHAASLPHEELKKRSVQAWEYARAHHTRDMFTKKFAEFADLLETKLAER